MHVPRSALCLLGPLFLSACSVLFDAAPAQEAADAGISPEAADAAAEPDAAFQGCQPFSCETGSVALYHFSEASPLESDCEGAPLFNADSTFTDTGFNEAMGTALRLQPEQVLSNAIDLQGSWTIDFWIQPESQQGDVLSMLTQILSGPCGLKVRLASGALRVEWDTSVSTTVRGIVELDAFAWNQVTISYVKNGSSAVLRFWVNGGEMIEGSINQCNGEKTALVVGDWDQDSVIGGFEGKLDELRVRDLAVTAPAFCDLGM